jgi:hypothetical protein
MNMARISAGCSRAGAMRLPITVRVTCGVDGNNQIVPGDWPGILVEEDVHKPFVVKVSGHQEIAYGGGLPSETTDLGQIPIRAGSTFSIGADARYEIERYYVHCNGSYLARVTAECVNSGRAKEALTLYCVIDERGRVAFGDWMGYATKGEEKLPFLVCNRAQSFFQYRNAAEKTTFRSALVGEYFNVSPALAPRPEGREFQVVSCELL